MEFEWDLKKARDNRKKHGVTFEEASTVVGDWLGITVPDPDHSLDEDRYVALGTSNQNRLLIVSFAERNKRYRIISARTLTRHEREAYEKEHN